MLIFASKLLLPFKYNWHNSHLIRNPYNHSFIMEENKQGRITAQNAVSNAENLQSSEKVDNFAKILSSNPMTDFGFKKFFGDAEIMKAFLNDVSDPAEVAH